MATVLATYSWAADSAELKAFLGAADSEDAVLQEIYEAGIQECHEQLDERDFVDADGVSLPTTDTPNPIALGLKLYVKTFRDRLRRGSGVLESKTATRTLKYDNQETAEAALKAALPHWRRYRLDATRLGS